MTTRQEYLDLLAANSSDTWLEPKLEDADNLAILSALADMAARLDRSQVACNDALLISQAPGGAPGTTFVTLTAAAGPGGTLTAGLVLFEDARGWVYALTADVAVPAGPATVVVHIASQRQNNLVNTVDDPDIAFFGLRAVADATNDPGTITLSFTSEHIFHVGDIIKVEGVLGNTAANGIRRVRSVPSSTEIVIETTAGGNIPGNGDFAGGGTTQPAPLQLEVVSAEPVVGGWVDMLSMHARERGQIRQQGEDTETFRARVRNITDVVSPIALSEAILGSANSFGLTDVEIREPFYLGETQALRDELQLDEFQGLFLDEHFLDDPGRILYSLREVTAYFEIDVGQPDQLLQYGFFLDGTPAVASFFDGLAFFDAETETYLQTAFSAIRQEVERKRAAGVSYDIVYDVWRVAQGRGVITNAADTLAFTLTPPAGRVWDVIEFMVGISAPALPVPGNAYSQYLIFTFEDATTFQTPTQILYDPTPGSDQINGIDNYPLWRLTALGFPYGKRVTQVEGFVDGDGVTALTQVASIWVAETTL